MLTNADSAGAAYNEAGRVGPVVRSALGYADEVIVVDDGSTEATTVVAGDAGAWVIRQNNAGYIAAAKRGSGRHRARWW